MSEIFTKKNEKLKKLEANTKQVSREKISFIENF